MQTPRHEESVVGAVYALFIVSGFTGLAYEVIWTRLLVRVFGTSTFAVTTVLAAYMAGLALGSVIFGRLVDRKGDGLNLYGLLELGIGAFAIVSPYLISMLAHVYGGFYSALETHFYALTAVRFLLSFGAILIPTTLMGGTLPVLSKYLVTGLAGLAERVGGLYAANTLGAVGGAAAAGLYILPHLGMRDTILVCACLNAGIGAVAILLGRRSLVVPDGVAPEPAESAGTSHADRSTSRQVLAIFTLTGFCALAAEVIWTRMLSLVVGTTVYAFAIMLATFLVGLGSGSASSAHLAQRSKRPGRLLGVTVAGIGLAILGSLVFYGRMPLLYMRLYSDTKPTAEGLLWVQAALSALTVLPPAFLMGGLFPLVTRLYARSISRVGRQIGRIYAFNTMGSVLGSVAGSFLFLKYVGMETSMIVIGGIYLVTGGVVAAQLGEFRQRGLRLGLAGAAAAVAVLAVAAFPRIDVKVLTSGVYVYAPVYKTAEGLMDHMRRISILFYDEGVAATVSLERFRGDLSLLIDGKADASTGLQDMRTQVMLAQLPLLLHPDPDTVLVIGLGSGVTLGSAETHDVGRIDCVELLENVVAASEHLQAYNLDCLADPRAHLVIGDGRNHLLLTHRRYDVIISEPTNPWISGVGDLFTQEFFRMARGRLKPGGLMCAWFHTYNMADMDVRAMVATFVAVFPEASLWLINDGDIILLGGLGPMTVDEDLARRMSVQRVAADLDRIRVESPLDLVANYITDTAGLVRYAGPVALNTDDNMLLEFSAGLKGFEATETVHLSNFIGLMALPPVADWDDPDFQRLHTRMEARKTAVEAVVDLAKLGAESVMPLFARAYALSPSDPYVQDKYIEMRMMLGRKLYAEGDYEGARDNFLAALALPGHPLAWQAHLGLGTALAAIGDREGARENFRAAIALHPDNARAYHYLGRLERVTGHAEEAAAALERSLKLEPDPGVASDLSRIYMEMGIHLDQALHLAQEAVTWEASPEHYITLGWAYNRLGEDRPAEKAMLKAIEMAPDDTEAMFDLATMRLARDDVDGAVESLEALVALGKDDRFSRLAAERLRELRGSKGVTPIHRSE